ncbi:hypothetical protein, partial [Staphylococcus aureus]|uniref:hypothetical protein n=1 Tax=Staphylococcus aureus TaxID=1280 RepID=UPI00197F0BEA
MMAIAWDGHPYWLRISLFFGLGEALILTSYVLGCNNIDALIAYFLLFAARGKIFARQLADPCYSAVSLINICLPVVKCFWIKN